MKELSIIMPYYNEGFEFISETIESIKSTIDIEDYEIIIVDDFSEIPLKLDDINVIRHSENKGVGAVFDTGVSIAKSDNLFIMGCDVRFIANNWASLMIKEINLHPHSLICTSTVHLNYGNPTLTFEMSRQNFVYNGANILIAYGGPDGERDILHAKWLPYFSRFVPPDFEVKKSVLSQYGINPSETESYEIPCILGAAYGVKKDWYKYINGWWGHRKWGTLESYISLKSWMFGGSCLTAPHIETAHLFKDEKSASKKDSDCLAYNSILICWLLLPVKDKNKLIDWLNHPNKEKALQMIEENMEEIWSKRLEYKSKILMKFLDFCKRFNLNY